MKIGFYDNDDTRYVLRDGDAFHWIPSYGMVEFKPVVSTPLKIRADNEVMAASVLGYNVRSFELFKRLMNAVCMTNGLWPHMSENDTVCTLRETKPGPGSPRDIQHLVDGAPL